MSPSRPDASSHLHATGCLTCGEPLTAGIPWFCETCREPGTCSSCNADISPDEHPYPLFHFAWDWDPICANCFRALADSATWEALPQLVAVHTSLMEDIYELIVDGSEPSRTERLTHGWDHIGQLLADLHHATELLGGCDLTVEHQQQIYAAAAGLLGDEAVAEIEALAAQIRHARRQLDR